MPTKFSDFFICKPEADAFQQRLYDVIKDATTIVDCYRRLYEYIIEGLKWSSRQDRRANMQDNDKVVVAGNDSQKQKMADAQEYFEEGEVGERKVKVLFEYLKMVAAPKATYGDNVYVLKFDDTRQADAKKACRQVELYSRVQAYLGQYDEHNAYQQAHPATTKPLPAKFSFDAKSSPLNPDDPAQRKKLTDCIDELIDWVKENYPDLKAALAAKAMSGLFELVFTPEKLPWEKIAAALDIMVMKIGNLAGPKNNRGALSNEFGDFLIEKIGNDKFWEKKIGSAYRAIAARTATFKDNPKNRREIYSFFAELFTDFLSTSPSAAENETSDQAKQRCKDALQRIKAVFEEFPSNKLFKSMMEAVLARLQKDYQKDHAGALIEAKKDIPSNVKTVLPEDVADALKEMADEHLETLPLLLRHDNTEVKFLTIANFKDLAALDDAFYNLNKNGTTSSVEVKSDPEENGNRKDRPIYRSLSTRSALGFAFCNLPNLLSGTFNYVDDAAPAIAKVADSKDANRILEIDFQKYTIDKKTKDASGRSYAANGRTAHFFEALKANTKWTDIHVRRYDPYYATNPADAAKPEAHLAAFKAAGRGASRIWPLCKDDLCVWTWENPGPIYDELGEILGLPAKRRIVFPKGATLAAMPLTTAHQVHIGGAPCDLVNYGRERFRTGGFYYEIIGITEDIGEEQLYVKVNTPTAGLSAALTADTPKQWSRPLTGDVLDKFNFGYYRRITGTTDDQPGQAQITDDMKVVQLFKKRDSRLPNGAEKLDKYSDKDFDAIGLNLPVCFNFKENVIQYFRIKKGRGKIINKGENLHREVAPRKDAGTAMKSIFGYVKPPMSTRLSASKVPATAFANGAMGQSEQVREDWGVLKLDSRNSFPVPQEWCHLRGHGDSGPEYPGNFVSGSYHCNTEQLAVETGQRVVTQQKRAGTFLLHTTAYLLRDAVDYSSKVLKERTSEILTGNYLLSQGAYQDMLKSNTARKTRERDDGQPSKKTKANQKDDGDMDVESSSLQQGDVAPLAACIRYKVTSWKEVEKGTGKRLRTTESLTKFFDFIFEGQGEFIDANQFTIISQAVRFALAGREQFDAWYTDASQALADSKAQQVQ